MNGLLPAARDLTNVKVTDTPSGEGFRSITLTWIDAFNMPRSETFRGMDAHRVHADLTAAAAFSNEARHAHLVGLARAFSIHTSRRAAA